MTKTNPNFDTLLTYYFSVPDFFEDGKLKDKFVVLALDPFGLPKGTKGIIINYDYSGHLLVKTDDGKVSYCDRTSVVPESKFNEFKEDFENGKIEVAVNKVFGEERITVFRVA